LPVVLYGCETRPVIVSSEHRLREFENRVLRKIFGPKRDDVTGGGENYIMNSLMICTVHQLLLGVQIKKDEVDRAFG
jgi:hypothetical protein